MDGNFPFKQYSIDMDIYTDIMVVSFICYIVKEFRFLFAR